MQDTLEAGAGLCDPEAVRFVTERGPAAVRWLAELGVAFTLDDTGTEFHLTREGGHSHRRVIHANDTTGREVETTLIRCTKQRPNIALLENRVAIELITSNKLSLNERPRCIGAYVLDRSRDKVDTFTAAATVLATGGASKVYLHTSNPDGATGDGIAMAWRAGCRVSNLEFMQFHPTCLYHSSAKGLLISEAVRGEGGKLRLPSGETFMQRFDQRKDLAPRDIVARAINHEMKRLGIDYVYLDISHRSKAFIHHHFPSISAMCARYGYDLAQAPVPVVPAAHYSCGGITTNLASQTDLAELYAIGETAHTGLHGANRMASNSLLECLVLAESASQSISHSIQDKPQARITTPQIPPWDQSRVTDSYEAVVVAHHWDELRRLMWDSAGIVRTRNRLAHAQHRVELLKREVDEYYGNSQVTRNLIELRNLLTVAELMLRSAQARKESRGLHYTLDYPDTLANATNTVLVPTRSNQSHAMPRAGAL